MAGGAAIGMQAAGGVMGAFGTYQSGLAQSGYYRYLANKSRTEQQLVQQQADQESNSAQNEGAFLSGREQRSTRQLEGAQATAEAANGTAGSVTSADIARDTFDKAKMDQLAIKYNADSASWRAQQGAKLQKWNLENEAQSDEAAARNAKQAGKIGAISSLLSSSGQVADSWYKLKQSAPSKGPTARSSMVGGGKPFPVGTGEY